MSLERRISVNIPETNMGGFDGCHIPRPSHSQVERTLLKVDFGCFQRTDVPRRLTPGFRVVRHERNATRAPPPSPRRNPRIPSPLALKVSEVLGGSGELVSRLMIMMITRVLHGFNGL